MTGKNWSDSAMNPLCDKCLNLPFRMHWQYHLLSGKNLTKRGVLWKDSQLHLMMRIQFWRSEEGRAPPSLPLLPSQNWLKEVALFRVASMGQIDLFKNNSFEWEYLKPYDCMETIYYYSIGIVTLNIKIVYSLLAKPTGWAYNIRTASSVNGLTPFPKKGFHRYDTKLYRISRFQFWSSG